MQNAKDDLQNRWLQLRITLKERFGIKPNMDGILLLIGVQELGKGPGEFSKEEKQDLMHIAVCRLLGFDGYFEFVGRDADGWPHWRQVREMPAQPVVEQERLLKINAVRYFQELETES